MVEIKEIDGKLVFMWREGDLEGKALIFKTPMDAVATFENALNKLEKFNQSHVGWENITWIGIHRYSTIEKKDEALAILDKYIKQADIELKVLFKEDNERIQQAIDRETKKSE